MRLLCVWVPESLVSFCVDEWVSEWPGERVVEGGGRWVGALFGCAPVADPGGWNI